MKLSLSWIVAIASLIFICSCVIASWLLAVAMLAVIAVLAIAVWRHSRLKLVVSSGTAKFSDGTGVEICNWQDITIEVVEHGTSEGRGNHHTTKMIFTNELIPDIFVQSKFHFIHNGKREKTEAFILCAALKKAVECKDF